MVQTRTVIAILMAVAATGFSGSGSPRQARELERLLPRWSGGNIGRFSKKERTRFMAYAKASLVTRDDRRDGFRSPTSLIFENDGDAYVWTLRSLPTDKFIVLLNPHTGVIPSAEHSWLFVVNRHGQVVHRSDFDVGWRMYSKNATYKTVDWLTSPVLVQEMEVGENGDGPRKIYFGFDGLRPAVTRLENESGRLRPMDYFAPNWVVGPPYSPPGIKNLERVLVGDNEVKRLEALVWLAGRHSQLSENRAGYAHESTSDQMRYAEAIKSARIAGAVKRLRASKNPYVSKLAQSVPLGVGRFEPR